MQNEVLSILIPDGETNVSLVVINCLSEIKGIKIHVMSNNEKIPTKYSNKIIKFYYRPTTATEIGYINNINEIAKNQEIDLIMPVFEKSIKIITKHKKLIASPNKLTILPSYKSFEIAKNKSTLPNFLKTLDLPIVKSQVLKEGLKLDLSKIDYPVLLKPIDSPGGGFGVKLFHKEMELLEFVDSINPKNNYVVQSYIDGYDIDCSVLCKNGEILAYTIQKPNMYGKSEFSPQIAFTFLKDEEIINQVKVIMKSLDWSGVAHLDMRFDKKSKNFKVIEINPRFWGSVEASLFAGINFPYLYCLTSLNKTFETPIYKLIDFMLLKGLVKSIKKNKSQLLRWKFIFNNTPIKYLISDPKPTLYRTKCFLLRKLNLL